MRLSSKLTGNVSVAVTACENATTVETAIANAERADGADRNRADDTTTGFIAIDPEGAKDRDDAVWAKRLDAGRWHVKVAVADVGAYVQAGSPIDAAVRERAQSIYLVNECIHMCPEMLSSEICSLHEGRRKRALVTEFTVHEHAGVRPFRAMGPAWIAIDRAVSYEDAKAQIDADACETLAALDGYAQALRRARRARGAIVLECSDEIAMVADAHAAQPRPVRRIAHRAHHLIEEMMIAPNVVNARWRRARSRRIRLPHTPRPRARQGLRRVRPRMDMEDQPRQGRLDTGMDASHPRKQQRIAAPARACGQAGHGEGSVDLSTGLRCHTMDTPSGADRAASSAARRCSLPVDLAFGVRCIPPPTTASR